jgi:hypothetical protein
LLKVPQIEYGTNHAFGLLLLEKEQFTRGVVGEHLSGGFIADVWK